MAHLTYLDISDFLSHSLLEEAKKAALKEA